MTIVVRQSNFELLRIICMIMIVTWHALGHGGAINNTDISGANFFVAHILKSLAVVAVNCYVLISGFFGIDSKFKKKKVIDLYIQIIFYSIAISVLFWITNIEQITIEGIIKMVFPVITQTWWFMSVFLVLYLLTPYINKLLKSLTKKEFSTLLIILLLIFVVWPSLPLAKPMDKSKGYSLYNFILLYTIGAYIKTYYKDKKFNKYSTLLVYLSSSILLGLINISISRVLGYNWGIYSYNYILVYISSISLFLLFKEINIKSNFINRLSSLTLGVYLIHDHVYVRKFIYGFLGYENSFNKDNFIIYTFIVVGIIYFISSIIEYIRQGLSKFIKNINIVKILSLISTNKNTIIEENR